MNLSRNYKYNYGSSSIKNVFIAELKLEYRDKTIKRGSKYYLIFQKESSLKIVKEKTEEFLKDKNKKLESWAPRFFLHKIKLTNGLEARSPKEAKIKNPRSKFRPFKRKQTLANLKADIKL